MAEQKKSEIRYLTAPSIDTRKKKYCRFKKSGIKYIDYADILVAHQTDVHTPMALETISYKD